MRPLLAAVLLLALAACSAGGVDRDDWRRMSKDDRVLYVKSMIGAEKVKDAKGGGGRVYAKPAETYVEQIDAAYERGARGDPHEIFVQLEPAR